MSIIHDALKKVQQGLKAKNDTTPASPPAAASPEYLYAQPAAVQDLPPAGPEAAASPTLLWKNKIISVLIIIGALAIIAGSALYLYQQFYGNLPNIKKLTRKSFYKLILHKEDLPDFKTRAPEDLKPMAQITINPAGTVAAAAVPAPTPVTLNIHGIMSNASGNLVLINDQVYQQGDDVDGAKILKIDLDSITVEINGNKQTIPVKG